MFLQESYALQEISTCSKLQTQIICYQNKKISSLKHQVIVFPDCQNVCREYNTESS